MFVILTWELLVVALPLVDVLCICGILDQIGAVESVKAASDIVESSLLLSWLIP